MAGKDNAVFEVFGDVKHNVFMGRFSPPITASALPHTKPFCPCNEAILDTIQPRTEKKNAFS